jgi:hypothetical protein
MFPGQAYKEIAPNEALGTFYSSEYPYVFGTLALLTRAWTSADRDLSEQLRSYWVAYATTGNPNGPVLPDWPHFSETADTVMQLGDQTGPRPVPGPDKLQLFDELFGTQATRWSLWHDASGVMWGGVRRGSCCAGEGRAHAVPRFVCVWRSG